MMRLDNENKYTGYGHGTVEAARMLRKNMTDHEKKLWYWFLKDHSVKFYRQRPIGRYIADFYCSKAKLVIELDGKQHYTPDGIEYDEVRTEIINSYGIEVIRFSNDDIDRNFSQVCKVIDDKVKEKLQDSR